MIRICIVGASGHGVQVFRDCKGRDDVRFVAAAPGSVGENIDSLFPMMKQFGGDPKSYDSYREMLKREKPDIVIVDNYYGDHGAVNISALEAGCHIFSEKPVATSLDQLALIREKYYSAGVEMTAMLDFRYNGAFYKAWQLIQEGEIGEVRLLSAQKSYKLGTRPPFTGDRKTYGGTILWVGIHGIDWISWMSGAKFLSVTSAQSSLYNCGHGTLEMSAIAQYQMDHEILASLTMDYFNPPQAPVHGDDRIRVVGTRGVLEILKNSLTLINPDGDGIRQVACPADEYPFSSFLDQIEGKGKCRVSFEDVYKTTEAALKTQLSADTKTAVRFD
ncbi:MAG: Gfo/Idh/MocA family oxidoreductase [Clostridiaceae bacterium]|nr:Gfo/Idh/MocA family oxidoreductase [Clostridiaceae bacterium]